METIVSHLTVEKIKDLIQRTINGYIADPGNIIQNYINEKETAENYLGRQLLELLQNAYDAGTDIIEIELNTNKNILIISNNGVPFDIHGIESLTKPGVSSKNKISYIGNKGLGFRSILNWSNEVAILGREVSFGFSREYSVEVYNKQISTHDEVIQYFKNREVLNNLPSEEPIATLAFPKIINEQSKDDFVTQIVITYHKEEEKYIINQIENLTAEVLLFLPNLKAVTIKSDNEKESLNKTFTSRSDNDLQQVELENEVWTYIENDFLVKSDRLSIEESKVNYKIAWKDDLATTDSVFYTYFPTEVPTKLPFLIHATFELNSSRKDLTRSTVNKKILDEIVEGVKKVAHRLKNEAVDWRPFRMFTQTSENDRKYFDGFYQKLSSSREEIGCYPTIDNQYVVLDQVFYLGNEFSKWVVENKLGRYFKNLLQEIPEGIGWLNTKPYSFQDLHKIINELNEENAMSLDQRAEFIYFLVRNENGFFNSYIRDDNQFLPLLVNNKNKPVNSETTVFTKIILSDDYYFPEFVENQLSFIHESLLSKLKENLKEEIQKHRIDKEADSRTLKRILNQIVNIGSDDITDIVKLVVNKTNDRIKNSEEKKEIIKVSTQSLFSIYQKRDKTNSDQRTAVTKIPLINRSGKMVFAEDLYFGKEYEIGEKAEMIFEGIRTDEGYISGPEFFNLIQADNEEEITSFFMWLGVDVYSKALKQRPEDIQGYAEYIFKKIERPDNFTNIEAEVVVIKDLEGILKNEHFTIEKLIAWINEDLFLESQLSEFHKDKFYTTYGQTRKYYPKHPSYISYQLQTSDIAKNSVFNLLLQGIKSLREINLTDPIFIACGINADKVAKYALLLGVSNSLEKLSPERVYDLLEEFSYSDGKDSQRFYKMVYEYFRNYEIETGIKNRPDKNIKYYCRKGGIGKDWKLKPDNEVYYSDNKRLPQNFLNNYYFLNLPARTGEDKVKGYFGINLIKDLMENISVENEEVSNVNEELRKYIERLKPYFLAHRFEKTSQRKEETNKIKSLSIKLLKSAKYKITSDSGILNENDFLRLNSKKFVICHSASHLNALKKDKSFCDAIAEMISISFETNDLNDQFYQIFRFGIEESKHQLERNDKLSLLKEAKKLLGISEAEQQFWEKVFKTKLIDEIEESILDKRRFLNQVIKKLGVEHFFDAYEKVDFEKLGDETGVAFLQWLMENHKGIHLQSLIDENCLKLYHLENLENEVYSQSSLVKYLLWKHANNSTDKKEKEHFFKKWEDFDNSHHNEAHWNKFLNINKYNLSPDYFEAIKDFVANKFDIEIECDAKCEEVEIRYPNIFETFNFGDDVEDMAKILKNEFSNIYSLLHFDGFEDEIRTVLEELNIESFPDEKPKDDNALIEDVELVFGSIFSRNKKYSVNHKGGHSGPVTSKGNKAKARAGRKAENIVLDLLKSKGYEAERVSERTDDEHFDIRYRKITAQEWRLLEVKKNSGGYFYLSSAEKETASKKAHKYDFAIVSEEKVTIIESPFKFDDGETFENNKNFKANASEFIISFNLGKE